MKRKILTFFLVIYGTFSLFCYEWGGLLTESFKANTTDFSIEKINFRQSNSLALWVNAPLNNSVNTVFTGQASFKYNYDFTSASSNFMSIFDFDLIKFSTALQFSRNSCIINLGRFYFSDYTGKIVSQKSDGVSLSAYFPYNIISLYVGYTGWLNSINDVMLSSTRLPHYEKGMFYLPAYHYIPVSVSFKFPSVFLNQQLLFECNTFFDAGSENFNRAYLTAAIEGPVGSMFFYSLSTTFGAENFKKITNYSAFKLNMLINDFVMLNFNVEYASGKQFFFEPFTAFTSNTSYNSTLSPEYSGLILPSFDVNFGLQGFYSGFSAKAVLCYPESEIYFKGIDISGNIMMNIYSDLQIGLSGFCFMDMYSKGLENNYSVTLNCSFSF